jgi:hypothetical protein
MHNYWFEYRKAAYDLILESEGSTETYLDTEVESYVVHLFAKNFTRTNIGEMPVAIQILSAMKSSKNYQPIADECLLINSYPLKKRRWPSETYYQDLGKIAYGMAHIELMEHNFVKASKVLHGVFVKMVK